ncbi:hypothetical protein [Streptomyces alkaliterrae]|uniref:hypothetical protein n=1 Tax=Streptomyces alkaliterrae TaxID=2213162 RepID=UPI001E2E81F2|nr:hypothetical protein [Streptomyces alkaliterrae]
MKRIATSATIAIAVTTLLTTNLAGQAHAGPAWDKTVKCKQEDWDGRVVPTRIGNSELGWNHFSSRHNIRKCKIVNAAINGKPDKKNGARLEYWAYAWSGNRRVQVTVIVQYARKTADGRYDAGKGKKIGVITAYCKGMNKCPDWLNDVRLSASDHSS